MSKFHYFYLAQNVIKTKAGRVPAYITFRLVYRLWTGFRKVCFGDKLQTSRRQKVWIVVDLLDLDMVANSLYQNYRDNVGDTDTGFVSYRHFNVVFDKLIVSLCFCGELVMSMSK